MSIWGRSLSPGGNTLLAEKTITQNGVYAAADDHVSGYRQVSVDVTPSLVTKSITVNGTYNASADNADGYSSVTVDVSGGGGSAEEPELPAEYDEYQYLVCSGAEWIETALPLIAGDFFYFKAERASTSAQTIIGNRTNAASRWDMGYQSGAYYCANACAFMDKEISDPAITAVVVLTSSTSAGFNYGSYQYSTKYPFSGKLYTLRVYDNNLSDLAKLIAKFVPCKRRSDNELGFYDVVNGAFYTNAGGGAFTAGPAGEGLPAPSIESTVKPMIDEWDFTGVYPLVGKVRGTSAEAYEITYNEFGAVFASAYARIELPSLAHDVSIEIDVAAMSLSSGGNNKRFVTKDDTNGSGLVYRSTGYWGFYDGSSWTMSSESGGSVFSGKTVKITVDSDGYWKIYLDGVLWWEPNVSLPLNAGAGIGGGGGVCIGGRGGSQSMDNAVISAVRIL